MKCDFPSWAMRESSRHIESRQRSIDDKVIEEAQNATELQEDKDASGKGFAPQRNSGKAQAASQPPSQPRPDSAPKKLLYSVAQRAEKAGTGERMPCCMQFTQHQLDWSYLIVSKLLTCPAQ